MQVLSVGQHHPMSFGNIYAKTKNFSAEQKEIANLIIAEFEKQGKNNKTYTQEYQKHGFDFILKPLDDRLISLEATNKFSWLKWIFQEDYSDKNLLHIGVYNKVATKYVLNDLEHNRPLFKLINSYVQGIINQVF